MKLKVIVDNNSIIDEYYLSEPGLSFYIEDDNKKILFDLGYSDIYLKNLSKMNITNIDTIVLSHGHNDHVGGLEYINFTNNIDLYFHPLVDSYKTYNGLVVSGNIKTTSLSDNFNLIPSKKIINITNNLYFLGQIKRKWQKIKPLENDYLYDDSALAYLNEKGIIIITGCSHSGIINICEYAKEVFNKNILTIIGGMHILNDDKYAHKVGRYLQKEGIKEIYPCHCVDLDAKIILSKYAKVHEVGVSKTYEF